MARVQREVIFESHNWFRETSEITLYNECDDELDVLCVDRRALNLNLGEFFKYKYAAVLRAYSEDGSWLNLLRSADPCLEGGGPWNICFSLPAIKLRPHEYYTVRLMYEGSPLAEEPSAVMKRYTWRSLLSAVMKRYTWRSLLSAVKPYRDVPVLMWNYPPGRAPSIMPQSQYIVFRTREDWLEIDEGGARKSLEELEKIKSELKGRLDVIALSKRVFGYRMEIPSSAEELKPEELGPVIPKSDARPEEKLLALFLTLAWLSWAPYYTTVIKLRVNLLYRLLAVLVEILGFLTAALSSVFMALVLWRGQQPMIGDGLLLLTTLFVIVLGNYLTLPKGGPLRYGLLGGALAAATASVAGLAVMMLLRIF